MAKMPRKMEDVWREIRDHPEFSTKLKRTTQLSYLSPPIKQRTKYLQGEMNKLDRAVWKYLYTGEGNEDGLF